MVKMNVPGPGPRPVADPVEVEVWPAADGLVVYELPWQPGAWVVGLASHGWRLDGSTWQDRDAAVACARELEPLADWHANPMELGPDHQLRGRVEAVTASMPGRTDV